MGMKAMVMKLLVAMARRRITRQVNVGTQFRVGWKSRVVRSEKATVNFGNHVSFHGRAFVGREAILEVGDHCTIRYGTEFDVARKVTIGSHVIISNNVIIADNDSHPVEVSARQRMSESDHDGDLWSNQYAACSDVEIGDSVWICQRAMIMKGVSIGSGSIIAAGAVVTKDVPPLSLCYGNPSVVVTGKYRSVNS